jgi:hypothetical protein
MKPITARCQPRNSSDDPDLFGFREPSSSFPGTYPSQPGFKSTFSREAARQIRSHTTTVRQAVLGEFAAAYPRGLTADEVAAALNHSILTVRPRVSELHRTSLIEPTPERRRNSTSGMSAVVWRFRHVHE